MDYTNSRRFGDVAQTKEEKDTFFRTTNSGYGGMNLLDIGVYCKLCKRDFDSWELD